MVLQSYVSVRLPSKLKEMALEEVKQGYFKNLSDLVVHAVRNELETHDAVKEVRKMREERWDNYMKKAGGDREKAGMLFYKDIKKWEKESDFINK